MAVPTTSVHATQSFRSHVQIKIKSAPRARTRGQLIIFCRESTKARPNLQIKNKGAARYPRSQKQHYYLKLLEICCSYILYNDAPFVSEPYRPRATAGPVFPHVNDAFQSHAATINTAEYSFRAFALKGHYHGKCPRYGSFVTLPKRKQRYLCEL